MLKLENFEQVIEDIVKYSYTPKETTPIDRHYTGFKK
jgi:hypothetical protein